MQKRVESILRAVNSQGPYNILTFPTHEAFQSNWSSMPHTFYLYQAKGIKTWNNKYRQLPKNHILLNGSEQQVMLDMKLDMVLSQNKFGQFQVAEQIARALNLPLISLEHTLPPPQWNSKHLDVMKEMKGAINVFISDYSVNQWKFDHSDSSTRIVEHAIDSDLFSPCFDNSKQHGQNGVIGVVNDYINRQWCCNFELFKRLVIDRNLPYKLLGDTPGLSVGAKDVKELISHYHNGTVYFNTSTVSPIPTALLEAMSCGLPCVSTATCQIPDIINDGINGFCSNDEDYLYEKLRWCLDNPVEAISTVGVKARETIVKRFSVEKHVASWMQIFDEIYGKGHNV